MNLQPLGDRVVVKPLSEEDMKTPSGIYIPDTAKEKPPRRRGCCCRTWRN